MDEISAAILKKSLDGLSVRYAFTAQNVANINSPDYQPVRVSFEAELKAAASRGLAAISNVQPRVHALDAAYGAGDSRVDLELADASQTALRYRAMMDILGRELSLQRAIISDGGR